MSQKEITPYGIDQDCLYGGIFDLCTPTTKIDLNSVRAPLLFYKAVAVPDGFFWCHGPLQRQLEVELSGKDMSAGEGQIINYISAGLIVPQLRKHENFSTLWKLGPEVGVAWGKYLVIDKDYGSSFLAKLDQHLRHFAAWPNQMDPAAETQKPNEEKLIPYADLLSIYMHHPTFELKNDERLEERIRSMFSDAPADDRQNTITMIRGFFNLIHTSTGDRRFRRGKIEDFIRQQIGSGKLIYNDVHGQVFMRSRFAHRTVANRLLNFSSSVYQLHQSHGFGCSTQFFKGKDPLVALHEGSCSASGDQNFANAIFQGSIASVAIELLDRIDIGKITYHVLKDLRSDSHSHIFNQAVLLRRNLCSLRTNEALMSFFEFVDKDYIPHIHRHWPETIRPVEKRLKGVALTAGGIGIAAEIASLSDILPQLFVVLSPVFSGIGLGYVSFSPDELDELSAFFSQVSLGALPLTFTHIGYEKFKFMNRNSEIIVQDERTQALHTIRNALEIRPIKE